MTFLLVIAIALWSAAVPGGNAHTAHAPPSDESACGTAIAAAARAHAVPLPVLGAIAAVESGRPIGQKLVPWPWSINVDGVGYFYATKAEAIAAVQAFRAAGLHSIDVGCMQINLAAHPRAFDTLDDAFDPGANARYAARFLRMLTQQTGRIADAMTAYHSHTPQFAADYARRLLAIWPEAATLGVSVDPLPSPIPPPSPYTQAFEHQLAQNRADLRNRKLATRSPKLAIVSERGAGWPATSPRPAQRPSLLTE